MKTTKSLVAILTMTLALAGQAQAQSFLTNGLVAYYPFNGNANDATGNGNNGQIVGNVVLATDRFGNASNAYHFDGSVGVIEVTNALFNLGETGYTISGWFCSDDVTKSYQAIFNTSPETGVAVELNNPNVPGAIGFAVGSGTGWTIQNVHGLHTDYADQTWYQFIFTKNGTSYTSYINGQIDAQTTVSAASGYNYNVGCFFGGIEPTGMDELFEGRLDDFRVYDRALSTNEIQQLYAYESVPEPQIGILQAVIPTFSSLSIGSNYQLQASSDLSTWTNAGTPFMATNAAMIYPQYFNVTGWGQLFFRLQTAP